VNKIFKVLSLFASPTMNGNELIYSWVTVFFTAALYCMKKIKLTQVLYSMNHKSIISLISLFFVSMFYVSSASAGPTYVNIKVPTECGTWEHKGHQHCPFYNGGGVGGKTAAFRCVGGGNGKSTTTIKTQHCGQVTVATSFYKQSHGARVVGTGNARKIRGRNNTFGFEVMLCKRLIRRVNLKDPRGWTWTRMCPDGTPKDSRKY
jgi:hypothetical protein